MTTLNSNLVRIYFSVFIHDTLLLTRITQASPRQGDVRGRGGAVGGDGAGQGLDRSLHHRPRAEQGK